MSSGRRKSTGARISRVGPPRDENDEILSFPDLSIGDVVSWDQYVCSQVGRLELGFGREGDKRSYRWDFEWRANCATKFQTQSFSGVNAQHMNGKAERSIGLIMNMARTFLIYVSLSWTGHGVNSTRLWPLAVNHAVWIYNRLPDPVTGITPLERVTGMMSDHRDLQRTHVWGCPVFVLADKLANGQKLPKFDRRKRRGQFMGFSPQHSSKVALVRNLSTGHISRSSFKKGFDEVLEDLLPTGYESYESELDEIDTEFFTSPPLHQCWLTENELQQRQQLIEESHSRRKEREKIEVAPMEIDSQCIADQTPVDITPPSNANVIPDDSNSDCSDDDSSSVSSSESEGGDVGNDVDNQSTGTNVGASGGDGSPSSPDSSTEAPEGDGGSAPEANRRLQRELGSDPAWDRPRFQQPTASSRSRGSTVDNKGRRRSERNRHRSGNRRVLRDRQLHRLAVEGAGSNDRRLSALQKKLRGKLRFEERMRLSPDQPCLIPDQFRLVCLTQKDKRAYAPAFLHANIPENENVYVEMPKGFEQKGKC
ncbi:hypothetical protein THAOC_34617 [Thalassiosira oceanica]|uniref:Integrase catalytic domain-containing protein n=1 Tax=Thalassiosira oceanica TaxID=159749 RepID=K0RJ76_THAOC|nr:hypothetical protein THAOC_34617 [Thalassiosira oceanica]|eukprot:EJK46702.1 hypothetical protein THAOC_34617 [Thalassiosira oceanica]